MASSAMTLQRYVRGWLTRRHYQEQRRVAEQKRQEEEARKKGELIVSHFNIMKALDYVNNAYLSITHNSSPIVTSSSEIPYLKRTIIIIIIIIIKINYIFITIIIIVIIIIIIIQALFVCMLTAQWPITKCERKTDIHKVQKKTICNIFSFINLFCILLNHTRYITYRI
jgi:hypothetical protein